jgi:hypothetical protein
MSVLEGADDRFIGKRSHWQAHVSIAARGIESFKDRQRADRLGMYPKALARLEYTSADIAYWDDWWRNGDWAMRPRYKHHIDRYDVDYANAMKALGEVKEWLAEASEKPDFDGGSLILCYSGHGGSAMGLGSAARIGDI